MKIRLSIIIPMYNSSKYIKRCLERIYMQDIPQEEYEVICVDDCSPDNCYEIVDSLKKEYPSLSLIQTKENLKAGGARNEGLKSAKGDYIWFIDADDYVVPNCFSKVLSFLEHENLDFVHFDFIEDREGKYFEHSTNHNLSTEIMDGKSLFFDKRFVWFEDLVVVWRKVYSRKFLLDNNLFFIPKLMYEDNDFVFRLFAAAQHVKHVSGCFIVYSITPNSITRRESSVNRVVDYLEICEALKNVYDAFSVSSSKYLFLPRIKQFINYQFHAAIEEYHGLLGKDDKFKAQCNIRKFTDWNMCKFISHKLFLRIKLGLEF